LAGFFESPWKQLVSGISEGDKAFILNQVGLYLRALGRLREAAQPMEAALEAGIEQENWKAASIRASNLSEFYLTLGEVRPAVEAARKSVALADKSGDALQKMVNRTTLADALHQAGETTEAETLFRQAEDMQKKHTPQHPFLYSVQGYQFCDLLLGHGGQAPGGRYGEVQKRAAQTLRWAEQAGVDILSAALDKISLGRAHWRQVQAEGGDFTAPLQYLHRAVDGLRKSGDQDILPLGLLARAAVFRTIKEFERAWQDLEEAHEIAEGGSMNLFLADYHLEAARVCLAQGKKQQAKTFLENAKKMIKDMQYHRRDPEVSELEENIKD
jgi:tetratricopeptide (TPR) repeat protein